MPTTAPAVSPDGARIAFVRDGEIWVVSRSGTAPRAVTVHLHGWVDASRPAWTADGRTLVFVRYAPPQEEDRPGAIFSVPATGGRARQLTPLDCDDAPTQAAHRPVLYEDVVSDCRTGEGGEIRAVTLAGRVARTPFAFPDDSYGPAW